MTLLIWLGLCRSSQIDVLAAESPETTVDFENYKGNTKYSSNLPTGTIYVAARFNSREDVPNEFILGDGFSRNGFENGPLKSGTTYKYALRVYSATDPSLVSVSNVLTVRTTGTCSCASTAEPVISNQGTNIIAVAVGCSLGGLAAGILLSLIVYCCTKRKMTRNVSGSDEGNLSDFRMTASSVYGGLGKMEEKKAQDESVYEEVGGLGLKKDEPIKDQSDGTYQALDTSL